jgi:hypothetical protein
VRGDAGVPQFLPEGDPATVSLRDITEADIRKGAVGEEVGGRVFLVFPFPIFFIFERGIDATPVRAIPTGVGGHFRAGEETVGMRA